MDYEKIIGHGLRYARKKVASPEYAQDLMVGIFESEEVMDNIKSKLLKHLFYSSLRILRSIAPACPYAGTPRYQYALVSALKEIGAKENLVTIPYTHFSKEILVLGNDWLNIYNLSNVIAIGLEDQMIDVKADPMVVAKLISRWQNTEIPPSMLTDILNESFALNKIEEILLPTARLLLQAILKDSGVNADIFLVGRKKLKVHLSTNNNVSMESTFYTTIDKLKGEVEKKVRRYNRRKTSAEKSTDESREDCK